MGERGRDGGRERASAAASADNAPIVSSFVPLSRDSLWRTPAATEAYLIVIRVRLGGRRAGPPGRQVYMTLMACAGDRPVGAAPRRDGIQTPYPRRPHISVSVCTGARLDLVYPGPVIDSTLGTAGHRFTDCAEMVVDQVFVRDKVIVGALFVCS